MASHNSLSPETVMAIYLAEGTYAERSRRFNVAPDTVRKIALGLSYRHILNPVASEGKPSCIRCVHHSARCTMDFPEYRRSGHRAAEKCSTYWESSELAQQAV